MAETSRLPVFQNFIQDLRATWAELPDMEARMKRGGKLLAELVKNTSLKEASKSWPSTEERS